MDLVTIGGYVFAVIGAVLTLWSRIPSQTIKNQKELIETQEKRLKLLEDARKEDHLMHLQNVKDIAGLQGQIKVYKELPLQQMATAMENLSESNKKILEILMASAITLEHNTKAAAEATRKVAKTLKDFDPNKS